ncbi:DNA polymerase I [Blastococcus sp. Marseille-P5729]|uniref:DNA polymerase I n=1 Tax=Blastococcus sp. Marseille-P5729 TaxID=2086582 RepID=UPI0018FE1822|nr:DNA polymerase I [Blastococcus sp. Marseille-P5729]
MSDNKRLLLLDGHSLAYRAFFALPAENFQTTTGQSTNAVYGFTSMLINLLRDEEPTHVAVAFDLSRVSFRTESYAEYKANRSKSPDEFKGQVSRIQDVLDAMGISWLTKEGFEADDIIATLTRQARADGMDVLICSGDRDAFQLVGGGVTVLYPKQGVSVLSRMDSAEVEGKYGVPPERYRDLAALVGETSDNLPGVPGVGPKTAAKWITAYGGIDGIIEHLGEIKGKAGESLREHLPSVERNYSLNRLRDDLELEMGPQQAVISGMNADALNRTFDELQFRGQIRDRLNAVLASDEPVTADAIDVDVVTIPPGTLGDWLDQHTSSEASTAVSFRGEWGRGTGELTGIALNGAEAAYADITSDTMDPADEQSLARWLADPRRPKIGHDIKGPLLAIAARGWALDGLAGDTALAAYLVNPGRRTFDLGALTTAYLHRELQAEAAAGAEQLTLDGGEEEADHQIAAEQISRAVGTTQLFDALEPEVQNRGAAALLTEMELPLAQLLAEMEIRGIAVDGPYLQELSRQFADEVANVASEAYAVIGHEINLGSPKQLQVVLFDELGLPKTKKIKSGYTTDADSLKGLLEQTDHPFLVLLMRHRDISRLRSVVDGLIPLADDAGRVHTTFQQMVAATGRLSSTDPNLQNVPVRSAEGRQIRRAFVPGAGYESLMTADYSQIEMRIMAHLSGDAGLIEAFTSGEDLHTFVAARAFGIETTDVDPEMRRRIKAMSYGLAYGLSAYGLSQQLRIPPEEARLQMEAYFERFGGVRDYLRDVVEEARVVGYTETIMGRRRYLPDLTSDNRQRRDAAERMALNAPIQGSAADIIKVAMLGVEQALRDAGVRSRMLLQVHDELVLEIAPGEREQVEELVRKQMGAAATLDVPMEVSVGVGPNWEDAAH